MQKNTNTHSTNFTSQTWLSFTKFTYTNWKMDKYSHYKF